jgi:UDP-N-acetylmuramoylalanine-D-glutamate ligase
MPDTLQGKRVLVLGFGRQGQALARWLPTRGASVVVNDSRPADQFTVYPDDYPNTRFILAATLRRRCGASTWCACLAACRWTTRLW